MTRRKETRPDFNTAEPTQPFAEAAAPEAEPLLIGPSVAEPASINTPTEPETVDSPPTPSEPEAKQAQLMPVPPRRSGVLGPLLGGALAAIGGFLVSHFNVLGFTAPDQSAQVAALTQQLDDSLAGQRAARDEIAASLTAVTARLAKLETAPVQNGPDPARLDDLERRLGAIEALPTTGGASTAALTAKLAELERRIAALPATGAAPELKAELDAALARLTDAEAAATARAAEAQATAEAARRAQSLDDLADAIAAGGPFLSELQAVADPALAAGLEPFADSGVKTLANLQEAFPDAARESLRIARDISAEDGWGDRMMDFLASQTKARPLTPQTGDGPEAVLSRAEFALSEGRLADAVAELDPLDAAIKAPLANWIADADVHLTAMAALQAARGT